MTDNEILKKHLSMMPLYDLYRLRECFSYSYRVEPANRDRIQDILDHIDSVIELKTRGTG